MEVQHINKLITTDDKNKQKRDENLAIQNVFVKYIVVYITT